MAKANVSAIQSQKIDASPIGISEARSRLAQHMAILQGFGYSDIATLGKLSVGSQQGVSTTILQKSGVLFPTETGSIGDKLEMLSGVARRSTKNGAFENITGAVHVIASRNMPVLQEGSRGATQNLIPINTAYWFATQIIIQDDTTLILDSSLKSLVIIAESLTIGKRVTISWDRPKETSSPSVPLKPATPPDWPQATSVASLRGRDGSSGMTGGQGTHGQIAPELELWFLQSTGFPAIDLRGQDGFLGGRGGDGGDGGRGQKGCNTAKKNLFCSQEQGGGGDGGNGGRAGDGGRGGDGGVGGKFSVFTIQSVINNWLQSGLTISVDGGSAGSGGDSGRPGEGGPGGAKGDKVHSVCPNNNRTPGVKGNSGASGSRGANGNKGILLTNSIQYSAITPSEFYIELTKPAITSVSTQNAYVGDTVSVNGLRFAAGDQIFIEGYDGQITVACPTTFVASSLLTFIVPDIPGGYALLEVVQSDGTRSTSKGTIMVRPRIDAVVPAGRIRPGEYYFLRGTGLGRSGNIWINGEDIGPFLSVNNNTIKFKARRPSNAENNPAGERAKLKVVNTEGIGQGNPNHSAEIDIVLDTFRMLVFGDSVMWGGGLWEHEKYYSLAAEFVTSRMENVRVYRTVKAHHGAKIGRGDNTTKGEMNGEISSRWPTILQQVDALSSIPDAAEVDLILIDGGANDLPITGVMLESDSTKLAAVKQQLIADTRRYCFDDMIFMLQKVISQFPKAKVIVTGYYHIVSEQSSLDFLQKMVLTIWEDVSDFPLWGNTWETTRQKVVTLSNTWVVESNKNLSQAVKSVNDGIVGDPRVFFVNPETTPDQAAHAPNSLLWEPDSLGGPSDPMWKGGRQQERDANEARIKNEGNYFMVKANSSYHPNPAGAQRYFEKMKPILESAAKSKRVAIQAGNGRFLCAEGGGNSTLVADRLALGPWETFDMIELGNNQVALKSVNGLYVCAENGGGSVVSVNRPRRGAWETFTLVAQQSGFAFKTSAGNYLTVPGGTGGSQVSATATQVSGGEIFQVL